MAYTGIPHDLSSDSIRLVLVDDETWTNTSSSSSLGKCASTGGVKGLTEEIDRIQLSSEKLKGMKFFWANLD